jgi:capsular polysaccharide biosynthesis protein
MVRAGLKKVKFLLPENCQRYRGITERLLAHVGIAAEAIPIGNGSTVCYRDILYFTAVSKHNFRKSETLLEFRDAALSLFGEPDRTRQKLFITRAPTDRRRVTNQDEIATLLSKRGFRPVYPGTITVEEQVRLFSSADHLVGSVGAGMSNMLFCPTGANIFYICNGLIDLFFWDIAGLCGQKFSWFFAQPPKAFDQQTFIANYPVDAAAFIAAWQRTLDIQKLPLAPNEHIET